MATSKKITKKMLIDKYMNFVLEHEKFPVSVFKFCKEIKIKEQDFYEHFGSLESLKKHIWVELHLQTTHLLEKNEDYPVYDVRNKLLSYFFTFFEMLTLNRSYFLLIMNQGQVSLKTFEQLKPLRRHFKAYFLHLIHQDETKEGFLVKQRESFFTETVWLQFLFLLRFWVKDDSPNFEKTDIAIEKSVKTAFDLFENTPIESVLDFGKFLWKEQMA